MRVDGVGQGRLLGLISRGCRGRYSVVAARICKDRARALTDWGTGDTPEVSGLMDMPVQRRRSRNCRVRNYRALSLRAGW